MTYTLYHCPRTRSGQAVWLAEEIGAPYQIHWINVFKGTGKDEAFLQASPLGKVPAIRDGATAINELGAIAIYLCDKYSYGALAPKLDDPRRGNYLRWIMTANSTMDTALVDVMAKRETNEQAQASLPRVLSFVEQTLSKHPFVTGETFTAADVLVASGLRWGMFMKAVPESSVLKDYVSRTTSRPAAKRAQEQDAKAPLP